MPPVTPTDFRHAPMPASACSGVLDRHFAPGLHEEILEAFGLEFGTPVATRRRDNGLPRRGARGLPCRVLGLTLLMPVVARRQLNDLRDELWTRVNVEFYKDDSAAVFKALVE
jgi:hypothetical protein